MRDAPSGFPRRTVPLQNLRRSVPALSGLQSWEPGLDTTWRFRESARRLVQSQVFTASQDKSYRDAKEIKINSLIWLEFFPRHASMTRVKVAACAAFSVLPAVLAGLNPGLR